MKEKDLIELLRSTIESDAIVSRVFKLFHLEYKYTLQELNKIINYGVHNNYLIIESVIDEHTHYKEIDWKIDNIYQEILMVDNKNNIKDLFLGDGIVPNEFSQFINSSNTTSSKVNGREK